MTYNVSIEVKRISQLAGKSESDIAADIGLKMISGVWTAPEDAWDEKSMTWAEGYSDVSSYELLKLDIIEQAEKNSINLDMLQFWYD